MLQRLHLDPFLAVIGPSGSGKSSLVFAGLLPALRQSGLFGAGEWLVRTVRPGEAPLDALKVALSGDPADGDRTVSQLLASQRTASRLLLVIDQYEEAFAPARQDVMPFHMALRRLAQVVGCYLVLTVRADFYPDLMESPLWPMIQVHRVEIVPLGEDGLRQAIARPAEDVGVFVARELVERLVKDAAGEPGALPLVQETLVLLWEQLQRRYLPLSAYDALGDGERTGLQVAMAHRADAALAKLSADGQQLARRIFLRLVQFGEGRADTRRQQSVAALRSAGDDPLVFDQTLRHLADNRLLTLSGEEKGADKTVDLAHEALLKGWPTLYQWLTERRVAEQTRRRLDAKVQEWTRLGKGEGGLLDSVELLEAEQWLNSPDASELGCGDLPALVQTSREVIERVKREKEAVAQRELEQAQALAEERRVRLIETQRLRFRTVTQALAAEANYALYQKPQRSLLLAVESVRIALSAGDSLLPAAVQALRNALSATGGIALHGHENVVSSVAFSPHGRLLASGGHDRTVRLFDISEPNLAPVVLLGHKHVVSCVAFSQDGRWLASGSGDRTVCLWDLADFKAKPVILRSHKGPVYAVAFAQRGRLLASGGRDQTVCLWNTADLEAKPVILRRQRDSITSVAFSPNGQLLATGSEDWTVRVWRLADLKAKPHILRGHESAVTSVAFSPDSRFFASGGRDYTVRLWDRTDSQGDPIVLRKHEDFVRCVGFSANSHLLASGSGDGTIRLWDRLNPKSDPIVLRGHSETVRSVSFSPNHQLLASGGRDQRVLIWDTNNPRADPVRLKGHEGPVSSVAFSPDGYLLAAGSWDWKVYLWDISNAKAEPLMVIGHEDSVFSVAFSRDGLLASGSGDQTVRLWDTKNPIADPVILSGHIGPVYAISFSPDGRLLASGCEDQTIRVWDAASPNVDPIILSGHEGPVYSVAFSPDGRLLASGGRDKTVRLWNTADFKTEPVILSGHRDTVSSVIFSPDSLFLASGSHDRTVRLWNMSIDKLVTIACLVAGRNLMHYEWRQHFGDEPYHATCATLAVPKELER